MNNDWYKCCTSSVEARPVIIEGIPIAYIWTITWTLNSSSVQLFQNLWDSPGVYQRHWQDKQKSLFEAIQRQSHSHGEPFEIDLTSSPALISFTSQLSLKLMATNYLHNLWISCDFIEDGHLRPDIKRVDQEVFLLGRDLNQAREAKIGSGGKD